MKVRYEILTVLFMLVLVMFCFGITYSFFHSTANLNSINQNIAKFVFNAESLNQLQLPLVDLNPGDNKEYLFAVTNNYSGKASDVSIEYQMTIKTYHLVPLTIELYKLNSNGEELVLTCDETYTRNTQNELICNAPIYEMRYSSVKLDNYKIKVKFPSEYNSPDFANLVDYINLEIKSWQRTGEVNNDSTPPDMMLSGDNPLTMTVGGTYIEPGATATDSIDGDITNKIVTTSTVNPNVPGSYIVTYNVSNSSGKAAVPITRTVYVIDAGAPVIRMLGISPVTINQGDFYSDAGATAIDNVDGDVTNKIRVSSTVNPNAIGIYTVTYNVSDSQGNEALPVVRTVNVIDNIPPVITMLGSSPITVNQGDVYSDAGAIASDNIDGDITDNIRVSSTVNPNVIGTYTVTYNVSDSQGNAAISVVRMVNVIDNTPPVITMLGTSPITIKQGDSYSDAGATASDNVDGDVTSNVNVSSTVNPNVIGTYTVTYNVSDLQGNIAITVVRTVNVIDGIPPVITLVGSNSINMDQWATYIEPGTTVTDNKDTGLIASTSGTIDINTEGTYTLTYDVSDAAGNAATPITRTVNVISPYDAAKGVNKPKLATGMTPIKWSGSAWVNTTESDSAWYDYTNKQWANAKTADGSFWVWIPRYAYQIASGYHTNAVGTINIKFLKGGTNTTSDSTSIYEDNATNTHYVKHPAFTFGTTQLTGVWIAKFEMSGSISSVSSKPGVNATTHYAIGDIFSAARNLEKNSKFGWGLASGLNTNGTFTTDNNGVDTHMMKNIEWGVVAYLTQSVYGKNSELYINNGDTHTTGCSGGSADATSYSGCHYTYDKNPEGVGASTTGTIYGIYDMSGGTYEYVMGNYNNGTDSSQINPSLISDKYIDRYTTYSNTKYGDAVYETSSSSSGNASWNSDSSVAPTPGYSWYRRGGYYADTFRGGIFNFYGNSAGSASNDNGFRVVLLVNIGL